MKARRSQPIRWGLVAFATIWMCVIVPLSAIAARSGKVLHARNADTRLHPASLTKMMTLYVVFEAIENGEITLDTKVKISKHAASEPPSKLGLRAGQRIKLRFLIRAAAIKSANDAATALAEAISGSEARFARRMNRTARAMGMTRTTFKNAHGLTEKGHLSTARDMTTLGRHVFYDFPEYYNLFSRQSANAGVGTVYHTNRRLLQNYRGADGIKTGYTRAAGYNLVASAERGRERVIATVFGGKSTRTRNAKVAELLDLGFKRAPTRVAVHKPKRPAYRGKLGGSSNVVIAGHDNTPRRTGKTVRLAAAAAVKKSLRPQERPTADAAAPDPTSVLAAVTADIEKAVQEAQAAETEADTKAIDEAVAAAILTEVEVPKPARKPIPKIKPEARPADLVLAQADPIDPVQEVVTRLSTSGGRHWGINVGRYTSQYKARKVLLRTALSEITTLDGSQRKVVRRSDGFDANFIGLTQETADLACRRLSAKKVRCSTIGPS